MTLVAATARVCWVLVGLGGIRFNGPGLILALAAEVNMVVITIMVVAELGCTTMCGGCTPHKVASWCIVCRHDSRGTVCVLSFQPCKGIELCVWQGQHAYSVVCTGTSSLA